MKNKKVKTLYFEGAGMEFYGEEQKISDVGNFRIRTSFKNLTDDIIYLELGDIPKHDKKNKKIIGMGIQIMFMHYITDDPEIDDCNNSRIPYNRDSINLYSYQKEDITKIINKLCNTDYDSIEVLPSLAGYRVHKDGGGVNLVNTFKYNKNLTVKREGIRKHFYELEESEGKKHPNLSVWVDQVNTNILHLLKHFNGYNKHWAIDTSIENCIDNMKEVKLGKYGC